MLLGQGRGRWGGRGSQGIPDDAFESRLSNDFKVMRPNTNRRATFLKQKSGLNNNKTARRQERNNKTYPIERSPHPYALLKSGGVNGRF